MLTANKLHIAGRRHTLLPATTLEAQPGAVLLIQADGQERRTALSLALTGRMKPSSGAVALGHDKTLSGLRKHSVIVDSPDVNEPENHLTVRSLAAEDLALVPSKFRDRTRPTAWLVKHGFRDIVTKWVEELEPARLLHLQIELALSNPAATLMVVDSPDRHTADVGAWLPLLVQAAADTARPLVVVGVVGRLPDDWDGPAIIAGNAVHQVVAPTPLVEPVETPVVEPAEAPTPLVELVETPSVELVETPSVELVETPSVELVETPSVEPVETPVAAETAVVEPVETPAGEPAAEHLVQPPIPSRPPHTRAESLRAEVQNTDPSTGDDDTETLEPTEIPEESR
ncbi:ABC transporter ATP-binding protein [Arthrobacter sp. ERGS1:01]|uniref:ABC transporter ATP-binding protein n=1 Tax=Arthrobacter sp. ERGS1:01 TaxID=1704044 RepID=UPI000A521E26|nr:ABC transporter ATP-binding protein [Arthrobacter sp. ERGS1:01]